MRSVLLYELLLWWFCFFGYVLASSHDNFYGRRYDHYHGKYSDSELMVDVLNNFGLRLLMIHNEHNENNIAFSPYGIGVILMALGEGLRGEALHEIRKAIYLPYDAHTIRVGLRDIHRHLKSYFIPMEGFLAGITLNSENVSINPQYLQLLKFYGYDINSFNTALYPESHITTTESGVMGGKEETTINNNDVTTSSTILQDITPDRMGDEENTSPVTITTSTIETTSATMKTSTESGDETTTIENQFSDMSTSDSPSDTTVQTTQTTETTTALTDTSGPLATTEIIGTSTIEGVGMFPTEKVTVSTQMSTTNNDIETTTLVSMNPEGTTSEYFETTTTLPITTTEDVDITPSEPSEVTTETELIVEDSTVVMTTESITTTESSQTVTTFSSSEETTQLFTSVPSTTLSDGNESELTTITSTTSDDSETIASKIRKVRSSEEFSNLTSDEDKGNSSVKEANAVVNKIKAETTQRIEEFGSDDFTININSQIILLNSNEESPSDNSITTNGQRFPRSIEEYVKTRYYNYHNFRPTIPYEPDEALYFSVNEKNKEAGLDFMTYDTVLPFLYIPNPSATALAFPLDNDRYYLLLVLPSEASRMDDLICKLFMHNTFKYILNNLELTHVKVTIPSFSLNGRITLTNSLQKLGIRRIFEPRQADFSPMTPTEGVYVTNIEQAVSITIKNNLNIKRDTRHGHHYYSEPIRFNVNRPFLYFVIDSELQIILMTGKVVNPLNVRIK